MKMTDRTTGAGPATWIGRPVGADRFPGNGTNHTDPPNVSSVPPTTYEFRTSHVQIFKIVKRGSRERKQAHAQITNYG